MVVLESGITEVYAAVEFLADNPSGRRVRPKRQRVSVNKRPSLRAALAVAVERAAWVEVNLRIVQPS